MRPKKQQKPAATPLPDVHQGEYRVGDRIRFQTDLMPEPSEALVVAVGASGVKLDGLVHVFATWHQIIGVVTPAATTEVTPVASGFDPVRAAQVAAELEAMEASAPGGRELDNDSTATGGREHELSTQNVIVPEFLSLVVRRDLDITSLPGSVDECAAAVRRYLTEERLGGLRAAVLIAHMRHVEWPAKNQYKEWLDWTKEHLGLPERTSTRYLSAGSFLLSQAVASLPSKAQSKVVSCYVKTLEQIARIEAGHLVPFLEKNDPSAMSFTDVKALVDKYLMTEAQQRQLEAAHAKDAKKAVVTSVRSMFKSWSAVPDEQLAVLAQSIGSTACAYQGARLMAGGVASLKAGGIDAHFLTVMRETCEECLEALRRMEQGAAA